MKGKQITKDELVVGRKYWVEFTGEDWCYDEPSCVHVYKIDENGQKVLMDFDGNFAIEFYTENENEGFGIKIYEWIETQYDRIKNMTIKEMGMFLDEIIRCAILCGENNYCENCTLKDCINISMEAYLKSEYKED